MPVSPIFDRNKIQEELALLNGPDFGGLRKNFSRRNSPGALTSIDVAKNKRNGRYNKLFKLTTPHVQDSTIQALIQKYPIKSKEASMEGSQEEKDAL